MSEWWNTFSVLQQVCWYISMPFFALFIILAYLGLIAIFRDLKGKVAVNVDPALDPALQEGDLRFLYPGEKFKLVTLTHISGAICFGGMGVIVASGAGLSDLMSIISGIVIGLVIGIVMMLACYVLYRSQERKKATQQS